VDLVIRASRAVIDGEIRSAAVAVAAAAGGITTLIEMPLDSDPVTTTADALSVKQQAAQGNYEVDVAYWGGVIPGGLAELGDLAAAGVQGFKCFLTDSGNRNFPHLNADDVRAFGRPTQRGIALLQTMWGASA
jgi:allantoinase